MRKVLLYALSIFLMFTGIILLYTPQQQYTVPGLPKFGSFNNEPKSFGPLIKLVSKDLTFFCSGFVIDDNYAISAAHCLDDNGPKHDILVFSEGNLDTHTVADTVGYNHRMDYGIIKGNFKNFKYLAVDFDLETPYIGGMISSCGFPLNSKKIICYPLQLRGNNYFGLGAVGFLFPGMSGGPAIDSVTGRAFALNSKVESSFIVIQPLVGLLSMFGIEP